jgi:Rhodanese-like domain
MKVRPHFTPVVLALLAAALLPGASRMGSAQPPPIELIKVDQLNALLRKGAQVQVIDVRGRQEYLTRHIKGAVSIPLDTIELRAGEIPRQGIVVLY